MTDTTRSPDTAAWRPHRATDTEPVSGAVSGDCNADGNLHCVECDEDDHDPGLKMPPAFERLRQWWRQSLPTPEIETASIVITLVTGLALLALLPYDEIVRSWLCFKFYAGQGCLY